MSSKELALPQHHNAWVWMDLEMTGLDPEKDRIIEMATIITDGDLNTIAEGPVIVIHQEQGCLLYTSPSPRDRG